METRKYWNSEQIGMEKTLQRGKVETVIENKLEWRKDWCRQNAGTEKKLERKKSGVEWSEERLGERTGLLK